jgi:hypothetical protein
MTDEKTDEARRGREEEWGACEIIAAATKAQLKKLEVFASGRSVYTWETVTVDDYPCVIVVSKTDLLLWGHKILRAIVDSQTAVRVEKLTGADTVVAEWMNGRIEVMTDDDTKIFTSRERWQEYRNSLDEWPPEIDAEAAEGERSEMAANKPQEIYHYTTGRCFLSIVADGVIKPATSFAPLGKPPVVWFTFSPDWEDMANKLCRNDDGRLRCLSREEMAALGGGLVRFVVDPKYAPYTWREFIRRSRIDEDTARALADSASEIGGNVEDWRVAFRPVPRAYWLRVDVWWNGEWCPVEVPADESAKRGVAAGTDEFPSELDLP